MYGSREERQQKHVEGKSSESQAHLIESRPTRRKGGESKGDGREWYSAFPVGANAAQRVHRAHKCVGSQRDGVLLVTEQTSARHRGRNSTPLIISFNPRVRDGREKKSRGRKLRCARGRGDRPSKKEKH